MDSYLVYMIAIYGLMFFSAGVHGVLKRTLLREHSDHVINIFIHSAHVVWVSLFSLFVVLAEYGPRTHSAVTIFPGLFLATFYVHELNVRRMTTDIKIHHVAFIIIFIVTLHDEMSVVFDVFNIIEFGHLFHFIPYLMYKSNKPLPTVLAAANISCVGFFLVRIVGFLGVGAFVAYSNWELIMSYGLPKQCSVVGLVGLLFLLQFWMYRDVIRSRDVVREKCEGGGGSENPAAD